MIYPHGDQIITRLRECGAVLLIVDPLNHAHTLEDGNNNVMLAKVAAEMNRIAYDSGVAGLVLHHLRKGSTGQVDDIMGATAIRATFRSSRVMTKMMTEEAEKLDVILPATAWFPRAYIARHRLVPARAYIARKLRPGA